MVFAYLLGSLKELLLFLSVNHDLSWIKYNTSLISPDFLSLCIYFERTPSECVAQLSPIPVLVFLASLSRAWLPSLQWRQWGSPCVNRRLISCGNISHHACLFKLYKIWSYKYNHLFLSILCTSFVYIGSIVCVHTWWGSWREFPTMYMYMYIQSIASFH